jgi:hypothetical protein
MILAAVLLLLAGGCVMDRTVELETARIEVESSTTNGLTPTLAVALFRDVANQLGFVVEGPIHTSSSEYEYSANAPEKRPRNRTWMVMWIDDKRIRFENAIHGTPEDFIAAQDAAALFKRALEKRGIRYEERIWKRVPFWGP